MTPHVDGARDDVQAAPAATRRPALWLAAGNLTFNLLGLATGPILARALGPSGRGTLAAILVPLFVASWVAALGLPAFARFSAAREGRPRVLMTTLAVMAVAIGLVAFAAAPTIASALAEGRDVVHDLLLVGLALLPVLIFGNVVFSTIAGLELWRLTVTAQLLPPVATLVGLAALWAADGLTVTTAAIVSIGCLFLVFLPGALALRGAGAFRFERRLARQGLAFGLRAWPGQLSSVANARLDQLLMITLVSPADLGFYVVAWTVSTGPAVLGKAFAFAHGPRIARGEERRVFVGCRLLMPLALVATAGIAALTPLVLPLLFGAAFEAAIPLALILLGSAVPYQGAVFLGEALSASGRPGRYSIGQVVALCITVPGLLLLLPWMGVTAAALVSVAAHLAQFVYLLGAAHRRFGGSYRDLLLPRRSDVGILRSALPAEIRRRRSGEAA
jgi:O-antigen/teichoic acid export membrane protein